MAWKSLMKQSGLVLLAVLGVTFAVAIGIWIASRWMGATPAQASALARMQTIPPLQGRDAYPALMALAEPVPPPSTDEVRDREMFCGSQPGCLDRIAADRAGYAALLVRHAALIDRVEALSGYDGIRHPIVGEVEDIVLPPYQHGRLPATRYALDFVEGRQAQAFEGTCRAISTWRRLGTHSDSLISRLIGTAFASGVYGRLFADMLSRVPRDFPLPASCTAAFSPPAGDELSMCMAMRGELRFMDAALLAEAKPSSLWARIWAWIGLSREMTLAERAAQLDDYCNGKVDALMRTDRPYTRTVEALDLYRLQCAGNFTGCVLASTADGDFDIYVSRVEDGNARLRLIGWLLRVRAGEVDASGMPQAIATAVADRDVGLREVVFGADGMLSMPMHDTRDGERWAIPLPPYLRTPALSDVPANVPANASARTASALR